MDTKVHLRELGLDATVSREDLVVAYRRQMIHWHPDRAEAEESGARERKTSAIREAFRALERTARERVPKHTIARASRPPSAAPTDVAGPPWMHQRSFTRTSLTFSPITLPPPRPVEKPEARVPPALGPRVVAPSSPLPSALLAGGVVFVALVIAFALVRDGPRQEQPGETPRIAEVIAEPAPVAAPIVEAAVPPPVVARGHMVGRTNREAVVMELKRAGETEFVPAPRQADGSYAFPDLAAGDYQVKARLQGWVDLEREVTVTAGETTEVAMDFVGGSVRLDSDPSGAFVTLEGKPLGKTPLTIPDLVPGEKKLSLKYEWWPAVQVERTVRSGEEVVETIRLGHGQLAIGSSPAGAMLHVDGQAMGRTPVKLDPLPAGERKVRFQVDEFQPKEVVVTIVDGATVSIHPVLESTWEVLKPDAILSAAWMEAAPNQKQYDVAPNFKGFSGTTARNGIVRNMNRRYLDTQVIGKRFRYRGKIQSYSARAGEIEFAEQNGTRAKFEVIALLDPAVRANKSMTDRLRKGTVIEIRGRLLAVEEPRWSSRAIMFEIGQAELLP